MNLNQKKKPKLLQIFDISRIFYDFIKWTGAISVLLLMRLKIYYKNGKNLKQYKGPILVVSNHTGFSDGLVICNTFFWKRISFLALKDFFSTKLLKFVFSTCFCCVEVDRENISMATFKNATNTFRNGHSLCIFAEGHIEKTSEITEFKSGATMLALMANVPIVPVYIIKRKHWYNRQKIVLGDAIKITDYITSKVPSMNEIDSFTSLLQKEEINLKNYYYNEILKKEI